MLVRRQRDQNSFTAGGGGGGGWKMIENRLIVVRGWDERKGFEKGLQKLLGVMGIFNM